MPESKDGYHIRLKLIWGSFLNKMNLWCHLRPIVATGSSGVVVMLMENIKCLSPHGTQYSHVSRTVGYTMLGPESAQSATKMCPQPLQARVVTDSSTHSLNSDDVPDSTIMRQYGRWLGRFKKLPRRDPRDNTLTSAVH